MRLNPFKKKKKKDKSNLEKDVSKISSTKIKVKVFKSMGGNIDVCRAEYWAVEQRNAFGELVSMNDSKDHEEDVDFIKDSVFRELQVLLNLKNKNREEATIDLNRRIRKQERLIFFLDRVPELNALYNYQDEWAKLRDYRVLRDNLKLDEQGSYFYIDEGVRVYEFLSIDGFFVPVWRGSLTYSSYPDHTLRKKVKIREDMKFLQEISGHRIQTQLMNYALIMFVVLLLALGGVGYGYYKLYQMNDQAAYTQAEQACMQSSVRLNQRYAGLVENAINLQEYIIKEKEPAENTENYIKDITPDKD